jgi:hypothetical protein
MDRRALPVTEYRYGYVRLRRQEKAKSIMNKGTGSVAFDLKHENT